MLSELYLRNYLFVQEERLSFGKGMTVITGETGAGKSILVGAISLIFGDTNTAIEAWDKTQPIYLEASFDVSQNRELQVVLGDNGWEPEPELILARNINPQGKSQYFLGGRKISLSLIREFKPLLIDFHHQRDQQKLLNGEYQLKLLDTYAGLSERVEEFATLYGSLKQNLSKLNKLKEEERKNAQLRELYEFQYEELTQAKLDLTEDSKLQQEYDYLSKAREIMEISLGIYSSLYVQEGSAYDKINQALSQLNRYSELSPKLSKICETISEVLAGIESSAINLRDLGEDVSHDQSRLSAIRERLDLLNQLMHKHKLANLQALLEHRDQIASFLKDYSTQGRQIDELEQTVKSDFIILKANADGLSSARQEAAQRLCKDLEQNVRNLAIPDAVFQIRIDKKADPEKDLCEYLRTCTESGIDEVEYMFSANPGSSIKPLKSVVSGGELSRILLAIKRVLIGNISPKLIILDEIDAGIGGKTADCIAEYIKAIAKLHRVLCITHLAAIAAGAENHIAISKQIVGGKTRVLLESLDKQSKTRELARMLSGLESEVTLKHAEELMKKHKQRG